MSLVSLGGPSARLGSHTNDSRLKHKPAEHRKHNTSQHNFVLLLSISIIIIIVVFGVIDHDNARLFV